LGTIINLLIYFDSTEGGAFTIDNLKIPSNAVNGKWKIDVISGSNSDTVEFEVNAADEKGIIVNIGEITKIPGFGNSVSIGIIAQQKTTISMEVFDSNNNQVSQTLSCTPTSEFKCQILWTIPKEINPGTYKIKISDSINSVEKTINVD